MCFYKFTVYKVWSLVHQFLRGCHLCIFCIYIRNLLAVGLILCHNFCIQVLELGALPMLMKMMKSHSTEEAIKALFAVSALIRNNLIGQDMFYQEAGHAMLQVIQVKIVSSHHAKLV